MARITLYSSSRRPTATARPSWASGPKPFANAAADSAAAPTAAPPAPSRARRLYKRYERVALVSSGAAFALLAVFLYAKNEPVQRKLTQRDIDLAVLHTLETKPLPSRPAAAYEIIRPSIVRVRQLETDEQKAKDEKAKDDKAKDDKAKDKAGKDPKHKNDKAQSDKAQNDKAQNDKSGDKTALGDKKDDKSKDDKPGDKAQGDKKDGDAKPDKKEEKEEAVGTGVVIEESGKILTALHVVAGAERIGVIFADGTESDAEVVGTQPENDIAVLQAKTLPDDLMPATLRGLKGLRSGDEVMAVGYPFGVGPSLSAGVISGFGREYTSGKGEHPMTNLIQFDAAANPGNSGGPLITDAGEVIGIVTAILNPTDQAFFVGIGFAVPIENAAAGGGMSPF